MAYPTHFNWLLPDNFGETNMRPFLLAGFAAIAALSAPAMLSAQSESEVVTTAQGRTYVLTPDQQAIFNAWTQQQRATYEALPYDYQVYYWSLPADRQAGYWALTDDQRGMIYKMSPEQREAAWASVIAQLAGRTPATPAIQANPPGEGMPTTGVPDPQAAAQSVRPAMPADPGYQGGPYKGALTPPPATAMNKTYPVCSRTVQDSCRNPGGR
jgi:hypothetical protein